MERGGIICESPAINKQVRIENVEVEQTSSRILLEALDQGRAAASLNGEPKATASVTVVIGINAVAFGLPLNNLGFDE